MASSRRTRRNSAFSAGVKNGGKANFRPVRHRWPSGESTSPVPPEPAIEGFDSLGRAPIHIAAASGDCDTLRCLLAFATSNNEVVDLRRGATPLIWATVCGHIEIVELLLQAGARTTATDVRGYTALQYALAGYANCSQDEHPDETEQREYRQLCMLLLRATGSV